MQPCSTGEGMNNNQKNEIVDYKNRLWYPRLLGRWVFCIIAGIVLLTVSYLGLIYTRLDREFVPQTTLWWLMLGCWFWCLIVPYTGVVLGESLYVAIKRKNLKMLFYLPIVLCAIHVIYGAGIQGEFFFTSRTSRTDSDDTHSADENSQT